MSISTANIILQSFTQWETSYTMTSVNYIGVYYEIKLPVWEL